MNASQLAALQAYIAAVARVMTQTGEHSSNIESLLLNKTRLETAFGQALPDTKPSTPSAFPDIL